MGVVWRATHLALERSVAIKLPTLFDPKGLERFVREGRLLSRLEHPNLVRVFDAGEFDGSPYLVMEFVRGCALTTLVAHRALAPELAVALVVQLLEGLAHAHGAGVLHRDVKSENALVTDEGVLKLADFGLARSEIEAGKTQAGMIMGTPAYMSPEQACGLKVDARSDLYSAAVVLFELTAGRLPFVSENAMDLLAMQIREAPPSLGQIAAEVPKPVAEAVARGLAKDPAQRFGTAEAFADCLREAVGPERLERAVARIPGLVAQAGTGEQVVAGTTFLGATPSPEKGTPSGKTQPARRDKTQHLSSRVLATTPSGQRTATQAGPPPRRPRVAAGLALALAFLALGLVATRLLWSSRGEIPDGRQASASQTPPPVRPATSPARPGTGSLRFVSRPPGAKLLAQGGSDTRLVTPAILEGLVPGRWSFRLELEGHVPAVVSTAAVAGETHTVDVVLTRALVPLEKNAADYEEYRNLKDGSVLIRIPGGSFEMGSNDGDPDEKPVHRVTLSAYYIGKYEVTWKQYREFCRQAPHRLPVQVIAGLSEAPEDHSVNYVSWHDASAYCKWAGLRLPTEAEWEYAARGKDGRKYPWGPELPDAGGRYRANGVGVEDGFAETAPVGSFGPGAKAPRADGSSPFGALDLAGNVWEWCQDWHGEYPAQAVMDPKGPDRADYCVLRGGSYLYVARDLRAAFRREGAPAGAHDGSGFRCAR